MRTDRYRSYVVRVRRRDGDGPEAQTRLDVEDLLGGARASIAGRPAAALAERLERVLLDGHAARPAPASSRLGEPIES